MAFVSALVVSSTSAWLTQLQSFLVSTVGWTLVDTGVSGQPENFVVRSSGVSGDRRILLKFGISTAAETNLSLFACDGFNSATDVASNATAERILATNAGAAITVGFRADLDHVVLTTNKPCTSVSVPTLAYGGLVDEFVRTLSATPNQAIVANGGDLGAATGRIVEAVTATFNGTVTIRSFHSAFLGKADPNLNDGLVYLFPWTAEVGATDRPLGTLKSVYALGSAIAEGASLTASGVDYIVVKGIDAGGGVNFAAVQMA